MVAGRELVLTLTLTVPLVTIVPDHELPVPLQLTVF
jgi:hypothetical protein